MYKFSFPKIKLAMAFIPFVLIAMVQDTYSKYTSSASVMQLYLLQDGK